jgi:hypothetical protein
MKRILLILFFFCLSQQSFSQGKIVKEFNGNGGKNSSSFQVENGWEIHWDSKGDLFQLYLFDADGEIEGVPANQLGSGKGNSYQSKGGKFYLQINALGTWAIKIIQVKMGSEEQKQQVKESMSSTAVIAVFDGNGGKTTRPFKTAGPWEIKWDAKGDLFQLYLYSKTGEILGVPANQLGSGKGDSYQAKAGEYYLQVNALGTWKITIIPSK